jgi:hypothetical protein
MQPDFVLIRNEVILGSMGQHSSTGSQNRWGIVIFTMAAVGL